jgi:hypothetical protein
MVFGARQRVRLESTPVVIAAGCDSDHVVNDVVDESMRIRDGPRPVSSTVTRQWFRHCQCQHMAADANALSRRLRRCPRHYQVACSVRVSDGKPTAKTVTSHLDDRQAMPHPTTKGTTQKARIGRTPKVLDLVHAASVPFE